MEKIATFMHRLHLSDSWTLSQQAHDPAWDMPAAQRQLFLAVGSSEQEVLDVAPCLGGVGVRGSGGATGSTPLSVTGLSQDAIMLSGKVLPGQYARCPCWLLSGRSM